MQSWRNASSLAVTRMAKSITGSATGGHSTSENPVQVVGSNGETIRMSWNPYARSIIDIYCMSYIRQQEGGPMGMVSMIPRFFANLRKSRGCWR